jgi:acetyl-CoA acetyltransferase
MSEPVYVIGAGRTDFKRNFKKEGKTIRDIIVEAGSAAIENAKIEPSVVQSGVVGNFAGGLFTRQLHLGSFITEIDPKLRGIPTLHTEAACASGSVAVLTGAQQIMAGLCDVVIVVGAEQQKTMSSSEGGDVLAAAGDYLREKPSYGDFMFPKLFARIAQIYSEKYGLTEEQLSKVAVKNYAHAQKNPLAQMRDKLMTLAQACTVSDENPRFAPPLKVSDCSQITDGGAALILCSERFARKVQRPSMKLLGFGHSTDYLQLEKKDAPTFTIARKAADQAYAMANIQPSDLQGAEVHDCFSITEIVAYEILRFANLGEGQKLLESGATSLPFASESKPAFRLPVNPSGGLMADGHPVGATGVKQVVEAYQQLCGAAGEHQIDGAKKFLTFNMGGSLTTTVSMIWGKS